MVETDFPPKQFQTLKICGHLMVEIFRETTSDFYHKMSVFVVVFAIKHLLRSNNLDDLQ